MQIKFLGLLACKKEHFVFPIVELNVWSCLSLLWNSYINIRITGKENTMIGLNLGRFYSII